MTRRRTEIAYLAQLGVGWLCLLLLTRYFVSPELGWGQFILSLPALAAGVGGALLLIAGPLVTLLLPEETQRFNAMRQLLLLPLSSVRAFLAFSACTFVVVALTAYLIASSATVWLRSCDFDVRLCESVDAHTCTREIAHLPPREQIYLRLFLWSRPHIAVDADTSRVLSHIDLAFGATLSRPALPLVLCPSPFEIRPKCEPGAVLLAVTARGDDPINVRRPTLQTVFEDSIRLTAASESMDIVLPSLTLGVATVSSPVRSSYDVTGTAVFAIPVAFQLPAETGAYVYVGKPCVSQGLAEDVCSDELVKLTWRVQAPHTACEIVDLQRVRENVRVEMNRCDTSTNRQNMKLLVRVAPADFEPLLIACATRGIAEHLMVIDVLSADTSAASKEFLSERLHHPHVSIRLAAVDALSRVDPTFSKVQVLTRWIVEGELDQASSSVDALRDAATRNAACNRRMSAELGRGVDCADGNLTALVVSCAQGARGEAQVVELVNQYCRACPAAAALLRTVSSACQR